VTLLWEELKAAVPLIFHGNPYLFSVIGFTLQVAAIATVIAAVIGIPLGLMLGLGRFRGRRGLQILANASLGLPPVLVGLFLFLVFVPQAPLGGLQLNTTRRAVYIAQAILAMPYTVALTAAAVQGLPAGLLSQARLLGAGRRQLAALALREARIGVIAAVLAALGTALSEVAAIAIVGGNVYGYDQTLASAALYEANQARYADSVAIAIVLLVLIVILMGGVSLLQHSGGGIRMRFRGVPAAELG
jgi:tungstate transport system permease protein